MKIFALNSVAVGSTGSIMLMIAEAARQRGHDVLCACPDSRTNRSVKSNGLILFGNIILRNLGILLSYYTGFSGCFSVIDTLSLLWKINRFNPDIIHLHNLHQDYVNLPILFHYIKMKNIKIVWTLHDCWAFTGGCPHFIYQKCYKWRNQCYDCPIYNEYPGSWKDNTSKMFKLKKKWFTAVPRMTIITPSYWLADCVKQSFLGVYNIQVVNNGIDTNIFNLSRAIKDTPSINKYKAQFANIRNEEVDLIVLGVASSWSNYKGLSDFVSLSNKLPSNYKIVLVGLSDKEEKTIDNKIIKFGPTKSKEELAYLYTMSDVYVNLSYGETFGMTIAEAMACGTPVIAYNNTAQTELLQFNSQSLIEEGNIDLLCNAIITLGSELKESNKREMIGKELSLNAVRLFCKEETYRKYVELYEEMIIS